MVKLEDKSEGRKRLEDKASRLIAIAQEHLDTEKYKINSRKDSIGFPEAISIIQINPLKLGFGIDVSDNTILYWDPKILNDGVKLAELYEQIFKEEFTLKQL